MHFIPLDTLKSIYFAHIRSILSYGIILGGGASCVGNVFTLQKRAIRTIVNFGSRESCRYLFEELDIMTFYSQLIYSLILFTMNNNHLLILSMKFTSIKPDPLIIFIYLL
jgi:hypothetical protein